MESPIAVRGPMQVRRITSSLRAFTACDPTWKRLRPLRSSMATMLCRSCWSSLRGTELEVRVNGLLSTVVWVWGSTADQGKEAFGKKGTGLGGGPGGTGCR